jgi:hypothetical protein
MQEIDVWQPQIEASSGRVKKPQSGRTNKVDTGVVRPVVWPHSRLESRFCAANTSFDNLDFALLVAGEAAIISDPSIPSEEAYARLKLLKLIAYYSKSWEWAVVRDFYSAALSFVERSDSLSWSEINYAELAATVLFIPSRQPVRGSSYTSSRDRPSPKFFCSSYNKGTCKHSGGHTGRVQGRDRWLDHFCAACFLANKDIRKHPEISDSCPRKNRRRGSRKGSRRSSNNSDNNSGG